MLQLLYRGEQIIRTGKILFMTEDRIIHLGGFWLWS